MLLLIAAARGARVRVIAAAITLMLSARGAAAITRFTPVMLFFMLL